MTCETSTDPLLRLLSVMRAQDRGAQGLARDVVAALRRHMGMAVSFVSHVTEDERILFAVDADPEEAEAYEGRVDPAEASHCPYILRNDIPELMRDARLTPISRDLEISHAYPLGTYLAVPIRLSDGTGFGTLCCFSKDIDETIGERDLKFMRALAEVIAGRIDRDRRATGRRERLVALLTRTVSENAIAFDAQPIICLGDGGWEGLEFLARFPLFGRRSPDRVLKQAEAFAPALDLERCVLAALSRTVDPKLGRVFVNVSPEAMSRPSCLEPLRGLEEHLVLEVTEHALAKVPQSFFEGLSALRTLGIKIAVDDLGVGAANLERLISVKPDYLKLDKSVIRGIDREPRRAALVACLLSFARTTGAKMIAEGVEREAEETTLRSLGVDCGQGYWLGRPAPVAGGGHV